MRTLVTVMVPLLWWPTSAWALEMVEDGGYTYLQISLGGLWTGFFAFLLGIVAVLIGLYLYVTWRKSATERTHVPMARKSDGTTGDTAEDDHAVF